MRFSTHMTVTPTQISETKRASGMSAAPRRRVVCQSNVMDHDLRHTVTRVVAG